MCKYIYGNGLCASAAVEASKCIGVDNCGAISKAVTVVAEHSLGCDKWLGVYCAKYKRFYCAGMGNCESPEDYLKSFATHTGNPKGS